MGYKLRPRDPAAEVRKVARQGLDKAIESLSVPPAERGEGVHQARKRFKELRALLRLVRKPLGAEFQRENRHLRDLGRELAESRDATAMLESWDALALRYPEPFNEAGFKQARRRLQGRATHAESGVADIDTRIARVIDELQAAQSCIDSWPLHAKGFDLFAGGIKRTYADGCAELARARLDLSDEQLHQWRKRVKDHWYQTRLLAPSWPKLMELRSDSLKKLADLLGDDHDLALMHQLMQAQPELFGDNATQERLGVLIARRRSELQSAALRQGDSLYQEAPEALLARWARYWHGAIE